MRNLTRRRLLSVTLGAATAAVAGDALLVEPTEIKVTHHDVPVPELTPALEGLRIGCLTDVHLNHGIPRAARAALEHLHRERPEVVVLIGDICNSWDDLANLVAWAREARGTAATFATLGNWEHDAAIDRLTGAPTHYRAGRQLLF